MCLCRQYTAPGHSFNVTLENVCQTPADVLVLIHAQMAVMKRDVHIHVHVSQCTMCYGSDVIFVV